MGMKHYSFYKEENHRSSYKKKPVSDSDVILKKLEELYERINVSIDKLDKNDNN
jgi:hypothetical protein